MVRIRRDNPRGLINKRLKIEYNNSVLLLILRLFHALEPQYPNQL